MSRKISYGLVVAAVLCVVTLPAFANPTWIALDGSSPPGQPTATILSSDETATVIEFTIPGFYTENITEGAETFQQLSFPGQYTTLDIGKPQMPAITEIVAVPGLANVSVVVSGYTEMTIPNYNVYPFQTPLLEDQTPISFDYDNTTYTTNASYPDISTEVGDPAIWRDVRVVRLRVYPVKHNPVTDNLIAYSTITVTLQYTGTDGPNPLPGMDNPVNPSYDQMYQSNVLNYGNVSYAPVGKEGTSQATDGDYDFLIIAADNYVDNMTSFITWKNSIGLSTQIVNLTTTGSTVTAIKNYISQEYTNSNISYVLLVGNESQIPGYTGYGNFSDFYYTLLAGTDDYPDIALGRFCVFSDADVDNMVAKSILYEQNPPAGDWLEKSLLVANFEYAPGKYQECKEQIRTASETASGTYNVLYPNFTKAYGASFANGGNEATNADVIAYINAGQRVVNYRGHGSGTVWWNWNIFGEHFGATQVNALNNGDKTPVIFSIACNNNQLDQASSCLGEMFTLTDDGAVAFLGASRASYTIPNHTYDKKLYSAVFDEGINAVGDASNVAAIRTEDVHGSLGLYNNRIYFWLGDPSLGVIYTPSGPQVINVPGDQPTIQAGINAASTNDEVVVAPGTYSGTGNVNVTFGGKNITVRSSAGPALTTIDCGGSGSDNRAFVFNNGETSDAHLIGFTIQNGDVRTRQENFVNDRNGGAIKVQSASPTIENCVFKDCQAFLGGAIHVMKIVGEPDNVYPVITDCVFEGCSANDSSPYTDNNGGAILFINSHPTVTDCLFDDNHSNSYGGAIYAHTCTGTFDGCTFTDNGSIHGGAFCLVYTDINLEHTIVAYTSAGVGIKAFNGSTITFDCNDFWSNSGGSIWGIDSTTVDANTIFANPMFCDPGSDDYTLFDISPCAAANSPCGIQMGVYGVGCTQPVVAYTFPAQNEIYAPKNALIMINFDRMMDSLTMDNSTVMVNGEFSGPIECVMVYWWWSGQLLIDPLAQLLEGEVITYVLTDGITDLNGVPLKTFIGEFTVESNDENDGLYGPHTLYTEGDMARCIYTADYNGDGELDLAVANYSHNNVSVRMGNGDGTFGARTTFATGTQPWAVVSADFDDDGDMDLASSNYGSENVSILLNNGSGSFTFNANYPVGTDPHAILTADLNGDGAPDLVTTNLYSHDLSVLLNNGDGSYASEVRYDVNNGPIAIDAADLDNDGDLDLFVACYFLSKISLLSNNGDGTFASYTTIDNGGGPFSIAAVDLDDDGDLDMAVANRSSDDVSIHVNQGDGTFAAPVDYNVGQDPYYVTAADLDGDADIDLVAANLDWNSVSILTNNGDATYASQVTYPVNGGPLWVIDADFNNDGRLDLAVANCFSDNISILLNTYVTGAPTLVSPYDGYSTYSHTITLNWADYDGATSYEVLVDNDPFFGSPDRSQTGLSTSQWLISPNLGHAKWYWKVRAQTAAGPSNWSYLWDFTIKDEPDPSCPVLYTYNGVDFVQENPLLTACEKSGYVDVVTDYYQVTKGVTPKDNMLTFQLRELEDEQTFLYNLELITVDHPAGTRIACGADGQVTVFDHLNAPLSAIDNNGINWVAELSQEDGIMFKAPESGYIDLIYEGEDDEFGLIFGAPPKKYCPIFEDPILNKAIAGEGNQYTPTEVTLSYQDDLGNWTEYSDIPSRDQLVNTYVSGEWINHTAETITIRIAWKGSYATDAILKVMPGQQEPDVLTHRTSHATLITADGSKNVADLSDNGTPVSLVKGDIFECNFEVGAAVRTDMVRDYIVRAVGRYQPDYGVYAHLLPNEAKLYANYPNPFNPVTTVSYDLPMASNVRLDIYNITGQLVTTLVNDYQEAGRHQVIWNGSDDNGQSVASGMYFYQLQAADFVQSRKMMLLK